MGDDMTIVVSGTGRPRRGASGAGAGAEPTVALVAGALEVSTALGWLGAGDVGAGGTDVGMTAGPFWLTVTFTVGRTAGTTDVTCWTGTVRIEVSGKGGGKGTMKRPAATTGTAPTK
jgi:hypothetical protein